MSAYPDWLDKAFVLADLSGQQRPYTLEKDKYYHICNRGINSCNLFDNDHDYSYFLKLVKRYLYPVSSIYTQDNKEELIAKDELFKIFSGEKIFVEFHKISK